MKNQSKIDDKTLLSLLDVSGSCVVDVAYNHLYDRAIAVHEKTNASLTDCYRRALLDYVEERKSPRFFTILLNSLHHYTRMSTIYNDISYQDCINLYSSLFIPQMYIPSLTFDQKLNLLTMIFGETIKLFVDKIIEQHISCIIDDHNDPINVEILQDCVLKILLNQRATTYDKFIESQKKPSAESKKNSEKQPQALMKITDAYKKALNERMSLKKRNTQLLKKNKALIKQFEDLKKMFLSQLSIQKDQTKIIQELKTKLENIDQQSITANMTSSMTQTENPMEKQSTFESTYEDEDLFNVRFAE